MCNAFGGIVLIAILVAMLIQKPGEQGGRPGGRDEEHLREIEEKMKEWSEIEPELAKAESEFERMGDLVALILERDRLAALMEERQRLGNQSMIDLVTLLEKLLKERDAAKERASGLDKEIASLAEKLMDLLRQLREIEDQTKDLVDANKQELRPPRATDSDRQQILFIVRYDEVFPVQSLQVDPSGLVRGAQNNTSSVRWDGDAAHAIQGSGLKIGDDNASIKAVLEQIKRHNQIVRQEILKINAALIVYPDSFDSVGEFRKLIQDVGEVGEGWEPYTEEMVLQVGPNGGKVKQQ